MYFEIIKMANGRCLLFLVNEDKDRELLETSMSLPELIEKCR